MDTYFLIFLLWIARRTGNKSFETWVNRIDRRPLVFTRVHGQYAASRIHLSITAFNPSSLPRVIRDLTLHFRVGGTPFMFQLADTKAGTHIENYRLPAHSISSFSCEASLGNHTITDVTTIHFTYLDEHNFRHHVWIDAPGRFQLPNSSPYA